MWILFKFLQMQKKKGMSGRNPPCHLVSTCRLFLCHCMAACSQGHTAHRPPVFHSPIPASDLIVLVCSHALWCLPEAVQEALGPTPSFPWGLRMENLSSHLSCANTRAALDLRCLHFCIVLLFFQFPRSRLTFVLSLLAHSMLHSLAWN